MSKVYKEIAFNFTKALNKLELRTSVRSFISMRKAEKVISLLLRSYLINWKETEK